MCNMSVQKHNEGKATDVWNKQVEENQAYEPQGHQVDGLWAVNISD